MAFIHTSPGVDNQANYAHSPPKSYCTVTAKPVGVKRGVTVAYGDEPGWDGLMSRPAETQGFKDGSHIFTSVVLAWYSQTQIHLVNRQGLATRHRDCF